MHAPDNFTAPSAFKMVEDGEFLRIALMADSSVGVLLHMDCRKCVCVWGGGGLSAIWQPSLYQSIEMDSIPQVLET